MVFGNTSDPIAFEMQLGLSTYTYDKLFTDFTFEGGIAGRIAKIFKDLSDEYGCLTKKNSWTGMEGCSDWEFFYF
jgi:hypothetical protein